MPVDRCLIDSSCGTRKFSGLLVDFLLEGQNDLLNFKMFIHEDLIH